MAPVFLAQLPVNCVVEIYENYFAGTGGALMAGKFKIKKGDQVIVITGRDKGKKGEVLEVLRSVSRVLGYKA